MEHSGSACASWRRGGGAGVGVFFLITSQIIPPPFSLPNHVNDQGNENKALDSQLTLSSCYIRSRRSSLTGGWFLQGKQIYKLAFCLLLLLISPLFLSEKELLKLATELHVCPLAHTLHTCFQSIKYYACRRNPSQKNLQGKSGWFPIWFDGWISIFFLNPKKNCVVNC